MVVSTVLMLHNLSLVYLNTICRVKEKTRDLAHSRRKKENDTFTDIAQSLPIQENAKDLDKASILRVAIHYLKLRDMIRDGSEEEQALTEEQLQNALNGVGGAGALGDLLPPDQMAAFAHMQQAAQQQAFSEEGSPSAGSPVSGKKTRSLTRGEFITASGCLFVCERTYDFGGNEYF